MGDLIKQERYLPVKLNELIKFVLIGREKLTAVKAEIRAIEKLELATGVREQKKEEAQWLAGALLDAETRIGELLKPLTEKHEATSGSGRSSLPKGITHKQSHMFQTLADNKDIIEQVKKEAEKNAVKAEIRAIDKLELATGVREQKKEEAQWLAGALLDAEVKIGELLKSRSTSTFKKGGEKNLPKNITKFQSSQFQTLADNKDVIEQVKKEADLPRYYETFETINF